MWITVSVFRYLQPRQPSALLQLRRCIPSPAASSWAVLVAMRLPVYDKLHPYDGNKQKKNNRQSNLDWYIHEVTSAHNKRRAGTGFHSYCMVSLMNPARGSLWQVPVAFQHAAAFSVHIRCANETLNVSFPVFRKQLLQTEWQHEESSRCYFSL